MRLRGVGLLLVAIGVASACVRYGLDGELEDPRRQRVVGGTVDGLVGTLVLSNAGETLNLSSNGAFAFDTRFAPGDPYDVTVAAPPFERSCTVEGGQGIVGESDVTDVEVHCLSQNARLAALSLERPAEGLTPAFDPETVLYQATVGPLATSVSLRASAQDAGATILVQGSALVAGVSPTLGLGFGANALTVAVTAESGTSRNVVVNVTRSATLTSPPTYVKASNTGGGDQFGAAVALDGDTLVVGCPYEDSDATGVNGSQSNNLVSDSGAVYVFVRSDGGWSQQAYLKPPASDIGDNFGYSVAVDGDTVIVGAWFEDSGAAGVNGNAADDSKTNSGAAYVFVRNGTTWSQQAYLKGATSNENDRFGYSVDVSGDTAVVGSKYRDAGALSDSGEATVFVRAGGAWSLQQTLLPSNPEALDEFGTSVAVSGNTIAVGAVREATSTGGINPAPNESGDDDGAVYLFVRSGSTWSQSHFLKASNPTNGDYFGQDLALDGDTLAVGSPFEDSNATGVNGSQSNESATDAGAVYIFVRSGSTWSQQAYVKASNTGVGDYFGHYLALSGGTLLVGSYLEDSNATGIGGNGGDNSAGNAGGAYLFTRAGTVWSQPSYLKASNTEANDNFGVDVAVGGDVVAIGANYEDSGTTGVGSTPNEAANGSGAVYLYR